VIGPKPHQSFGKWALRECRGVEARAYVGGNHFAVVTGQHLLGRHARRRVLGHAAVFGLGCDVGHGLVGGEQAFTARHVGRANLRQQPGLRVALHGGERRFTQTKSMGGNGGGIVHAGNPDARGDSPSNVSMVRSGGQANPPKFAKLCSGFLRMRA